MMFYMHLILIREVLNEIIIKNNELTVTLKSYKTQ